MSETTPKPIAAVSAGIADTASATSRKSSVPNVKKIQEDAENESQSPTRLTMNAFLPASDALFFVYQ